MFAPDAEYITIPYQNHAAHELYSTTSRADRVLSLSDPNYNFVAVLPKNVSSLRLTKENIYINYSWVICSEYMHCSWADFLLESFLELFWLDDAAHACFCVALAHVNRGRRMKMDITIALSCNILSLYVMYILAISNVLSFSFIISWSRKTMATVKAPRKRTYRNWCVVRWPWFPFPMTLAASCAV